MSASLVFHAVDTSVLFGIDPGRGASRDSLDGSYVRRHARCSAQAFCQPQPGRQAELETLGAWVRARFVRVEDEPLTADVFTGACHAEWLGACSDAEVGQEWKRLAHDAVMQGHCFSE